MSVADRPLVIAGYVFGFATESDVIPFTFDYGNVPDREYVIDLGRAYNSYSVGDRVNASVYLGEQVDYSFGVVIDPCK